MRKLILLIFLATAIAGTGYYWQRQRGLSMSDELKVAFPYAKPARFYEPTRIHLSPEYSFLENTYSTLVELSPEDASVQKGVAESWEWINDELVFTIRKDLKTIDGLPITAQDAEFSLKRLLVKTQNTHGNLKDLVCGAASIKSIDVVCEGLRSSENKLFLKVSGKSIFILPMLSGIDFAIIPKSSVALKTLDIIDYRNTSGPYYVEKDSEEGKIQLVANQNHYHYSKDIPQKIKLVPTSPSNKSNQNMTGLDLIEELGLGNSKNHAILVTSRYEEEHIKIRCAKIGVRLIPKGMAGFVPIEIEKPNFIVAIVGKDPQI